MQAALITCMAPNCAEPSAETMSSGQVIRVNSALQSQTKDTLFTTILQQGIDGNIQLVLGGSEIQLISNTDEAKKADGDEAVDVCSLLMQLMVMNSADQSGGNNGGNSDTDEKAVNGILGVMNEVTLTAGGTAPEGLDNAAAVILQNEGKAAEVLSALAASKNAGDVNDGQLKGDTVLAGIAEAMKNNIQQSETVRDAQAAAASGGINEAPGLSAMSSGVNENMRAEDHNVSKAAGQPGELNIALSGDVTAEKVTSAGPAANGNGTGSNTAGDDESRFVERVSREENRAEDAKMVGNPANQMFGGTDYDGETMAEKTAAVERALNRFTDDLRSLRSGNQEIRIVLEPESLGVLIISVIKTDSGISAKIKSEDKEVAAIITEHLQKLISSMQSKGITVDDVDVVYSQMEQNTSFTQHSFSQARDESSGGYTLPGDKNPDNDTSGNDIWQNFHSGETSSDTTVDYRV